MIKIRITGGTIFFIALIAIFIHYFHFCFWTISTICSVIVIYLLDDFYKKGEK